MAAMKPMTVGQLRHMIEDIPDDAIVVTECEHEASISGSHIVPEADFGDYVYDVPYEDIRVLVIAGSSAFLVRDLYEKEPR